MLGLKRRLWRGRNRIEALEWSNRGRGIGTFISIWQTLFFFKIFPLFTSLVFFYILCSSFALSTLPHLYTLYCSTSSKEKTKQHFVPLPKLNYLSPPHTLHTPFSVKAPYTCLPRTILTTSRSSTVSPSNPSKHPTLRSNNTKSNNSSLSMPIWSPKTSVSRPSRWTSTWTLLWTFSSPRPLRPTLVPLVSVPLLSLPSAWDSTTSVLESTPMHQATLSPALPCSMVDLDR